MRKYRLNKEERELMRSVKNGEWRPVKNMKAKIAKYAEYAKETIKKDRRISIRMSKHDLLGIQAKAVEEGIPYQTLITSLIHKYVNGKLALRST